MGFTVYYRSAEPVDEQKRVALEAAANKLCAGRTWLSCEPVWFFSGDDDGHVMGGSKPNFTPHPDDAAEAESEGLPDGTIKDALDVLCQLSSNCDIDWEISHDYSDGPIGWIRSGQADRAVLKQIEEFGSIGDVLDGFGMGESSDTPPEDENSGPGISLFDPDAD